MHSFTASIYGFEYVATSFGNVSGVLLRMVVTVDGGTAFCTCAAWSKVTNNVVPWLGLVIPLMLQHSAFVVLISGATAKLGVVVIL